MCVARYIHRSADVPCGLRTSTAYTKCVMYLLLFFTEFMSARCSSQIKPDSGFVCVSLGAVKGDNNIEDYAFASSCSRSIYRRCCCNVKQIQGTYPRDKVVSKPDNDFGMALSSFCSIGGTQGTVPYSKICFRCAMHSSWYSRACACSY